MVAAWSRSCKQTIRVRPSRTLFLPSSKDPTGNFHDFLMGEVRYASLVQPFPDEAKKLHAKLEEEYKDRWDTYNRLAGL